MLYPFSCECGIETTVSASMSSPPQRVACPHCGKEMQRIYGGVYFHTTGSHESYAKEGGAKNAIGINIAERLGRSPDQQLQEYREAFNHEQVIARQTRRESSKERRNMQCRKVGSIPREAWIARTRQHGKGYWHSDDPQALAKRDGFLF